MGDYQKELALEKLKKATELLTLFKTKVITVQDPASKDCTCSGPGLTQVPRQESQDELLQIIELIYKAKEHIVNI